MAIYWGLKRQLALEILLLLNNNFVNKYKSLSAGAGVPFGNSAVAFGKDFYISDESVDTLYGKFMALRCEVAFIDLMFDFA